jgi:hypothetical protein
MNKRPRFDFVTVQITDGVQLAQLCCFIKLTNFNQTKVKYYAFVRYLQEVNQSERPANEVHCPFKMYSWEYTQVAVGRRRRRIPLVDLINVDTIMSPAFVLPVYSCNRASPVASSPLFTDRFWHLDHKFCDRAGWDDIYLNEFNRSSLPPLIPTNAWMDAELLHPLDDASDIDDEDDYEDHS